ncbi:MAG: cytidylate kinase-like family protein [Lachnospiraceae bacterium]|nr:cytidylate kinase-like family protein [Lachnospiraceae bacterium]
MADKQIMISISREFGTSGHHIAAMIADDLGIKLYDRALLDHIAEEKGLDVKHLEKYDERPKLPIVSRRVRGHSNSMEDALFHMQSEFLQKKADVGESFVVVGRCAETALKGREGLITVFILGDKEVKLETVKEKFNISEKEALKKMKRHDIARKAYHNRHSERKWGDSRGYDLCVNDSKLGINKTVALIETYIKQRMEGIDADDVL